MITCLKRFDFKEDGLELFDEPSILEQNFQAVADQCFKDLAPAKNAVNKLKRGIRWGVYANGELNWLQRQTYSLPAHVNREEMGNVREFSLLPDRFVLHPVMTKVVEAAWHRHRFEESTFERAYEVQLSAIGYEVNAASSALPSPLEPHQDTVDGSVVVIDECNTSPAYNRIYDVSGNALYEFTLAPSEGFLLNDSRYLHSVVPIVFKAEQRFGENVGWRNIIIVRFQPLGR